MGKSFVKSIILCADDYGQSDDISQGIIQLLQHQRLSATSCMTNMPNWTNHGALLKQQSGPFATGLHFNLTEGTALSKSEKLGATKGFPSLARLLWMCFTKQLTKTIIERELIAQLEKFKKVMGKWPDFIDGHQHVHHFPVVREALLSVYQQYFPANHLYIRHVKTNLWHGDFKVKRLLLNYTGAKALHKHLKRQAIPSNSSFSGVYDFSANSNYRALFQNFCRDSRDGGLIMCHPGLKSADYSDPIYKTRFLEFQYFMSEEFIQDCKALNIKLCSSPI